MKWMYENMQICRVTKLIFHVEYKMIFANILCEFIIAFTYNMIYININNVDVTRQHPLSTKNATML